MGVRRELFLPLLFLLASLQVPVPAQQSGPAGFVSIDCGKARGYNELDTTTRLTYTSDFEFTDTGEIFRISSEFLGETSDRSDDLRSFPNGSRNCYAIRSALEGKKYMVRAAFKYGNYDGRNSTMLQFDLYIGVNFWTTVSVSNASSYFYEEAIAVAASSSMVVCLVNTGKGTPFVSSLEIRPIPDDVYLEVNASQALVHVVRYDVGRNKANFFRYPNDAYDRIWWGDSTSADATITTNLTVDTANNYRPPSDVMAMARVGADGAPATLNYRVSLPAREAMRPLPRFHIFRHFAELQRLGKNETRNFDLYTGGVPIFKNFTPDYLSINTMRTINPEEHSGRLDISLVKTENSTLPPILNAIEVYMAMDTTGLETNSKDVHAITDIKVVYGLRGRNWVGDPCAPRDYAWDGLNCSYSGGAPPRITALRLSSGNLSGDIAKSLADLDELEYLDLSSNNLTGQISEFLENLPRLTFLNLNNNKLSGTIPRALREKSTPSGPLKLSVEGNPGLCTSDTCATDNPKRKNKSTIVIAAVVVSIVVLLSLISIVAWRFKKGGPSTGFRDGNRNTGNTGIPRNNKKSSFKMGSICLENKQFTYAKLVKITNNFAKKIGKGGFGPVYHGVLEDGTPVAVKVLSSSSSQGPREFQNEAQLLTRIHHKNLVALVGYCTDMDNLTLVYEFMEEGNLQEHLSGKADNARVLTWKERLQIAIEAAQGLEYLHRGCKPAIVHRDVKSSNILLAANMEAKIADFGLSKIFENDQCTHMSTMVVGTPGYLDPEYYVTNKLTEKSDVFSFGIVLLELITGQPAILRGGEPINVVHWVQNMLRGGDISEIVDKRLQGDYNVNSVWNATETAMACTPQLAIQRPTMSEVLSLLKDCMELEMAGEKTWSSSQAGLGDSERTVGASFAGVGLDGDSIMNPSAR